MKYVQQIITMAIMLFAAAFLPALAMASTAANTRITNTVTVYYEDSANNAQTPVEASVSFTVNLVASAPTLSTPSAIDPTTENTANNLVYTITSTANGPDTYNFSSADSPTNMNGNAGLTTPSISLGGTTLAAAAALTDTLITVPYDDDAGNNAFVNGITAGDTIIIAGNPYTVDIIDKALTLNTTTNTVTIPLTTAIAGAAGSIGDIVGERGSVTVVATTDSITAGTSGTHSIVTTATSVADGGVSTDSGATVITVRRPLLTINKYVRNVTVPVVGTGVAYTIDTIDWYPTGVSGKPGDEMQYLIVIDNTAAGATVANNVVVEDAVPVFTTFVAASIALDDDGLAADEASFVDQDETADDSDAAELITGTVYVYAGIGGDDATDAGGTVAAGDISRVVFSVTID